MAHHVVMDSGPLIEGFWPAAGSSTRYYTVPDVLALEIRDEATRARLSAPGARELVVRAPSAAGLEAVRSAAKESGDLAVLSAVDIRLLALTYDLHAEHTLASGVASLSVESPAETSDESRDATPEPSKERAPSHAKSAGQSLPGWGGEWADASSVRRGAAKTHSEAAAPADSEALPPVVCATSDFAMQNVMLHMRLAPVGPDGRRIRSLRSFLLRCHACFWTTRDMARRFCDRCGGPTLLRTSYTRDADTGAVTLHLQRGRVWNVRGTIAPVSYRASLTSASASTPSAPLLREDQKEYTRAMAAHARAERKAAAVEREDVDDRLAAVFGTGAVGSPFAVRLTPLPSIGFGRRNPNATRRRA